MRIQRAGSAGRHWAILAGCLLLMAGCTAGGNPSARTASRNAPPAYRLLGTSVVEDLSGARVYASDHFLLATTLHDPSRLESIFATLEAAYDGYVAVTNYRPPADAPPLGVFLFQRRDEWEAFTRKRTGRHAPLYLQIDRGGYTYETICVVLDQGSRDTLRILAHEGLHLFIATYFKARPPPFIEEGLACLFETVKQHPNGRVTIDRTTNGGRAARLAAGFDHGTAMPNLRTLASMHAGNVVGLPGPSVDAFYSQSWAFVRFLSESNDPAIRKAFQKLLSDAATGALSSDAMMENPALIERYLGRSLESLDETFVSYKRKLASSGTHPPPP